MGTRPVYVTDHLALLLAERTSRTGQEPSAELRELVVLGVLQQPLLRAILAVFDDPKEPVLVLEQISARLEKILPGAEDSIFAASGLEGILGALCNIQIDGTTILRRTRHPLMSDKYTRLWRGER